MMQLRKTRSNSLVRTCISGLLVVVAFRVAIPSAVADSTSNFLDLLKRGADCYDAYQTNTASGHDDWASYKTKMEPALEALKSQFTIESWKARPTRKLSSFFSLMPGSRSAKFIEYLRQDKYERDNDGSDVHIGQDPFIQFESNPAVECDTNFRLSLSIDEKLSADERYQQLATTLQTIALDETLKTSLNWFKIETPAFVRTDPILFRFCYTTSASRTAIVSRITTLLGTTFKSSSSQYPPLQQRSGAVSLADYSRGYSFGTAACAYYEHFLKAARKARTATPTDDAIANFKAHWTSKFGAFESTFVGDLCDESVLPTGISLSKVGCH